MAKEEIFFGINIDTGEVIKDFGTLKKRTKELKKELDGTKVGTKRFEELKKEISSNQATIRRFNRELRQTKSLATRVGQGVKNAFKGVGVALAGAFAVTEIIRYGKEIAELTKELSGLTNQIEQLTGITNANAKALANQAKAINQVYGADTQDLIKSAVAVANQFGITTEEALDKIELGFAAGLNNSGEFLDILKEYPALLSEVGLTADETFAIINAQVTQGVYSDKGIDAIKEAGLRLRELPKPTREALKAIGLSGDTIQRELQNGTKTVFDVIQQVSNRLNELPATSTEVGQAIANIFGGPGEDAGLKFLSTLGSIDKNFESITDSLSDYEKSQMALVDAQENLNSVFNQFFGDGSAGFNDLKASVIDFTADALREMFMRVIDAANAFITLYNESDAFRVSLSFIAKASSQAFRFLMAQIDITIASFKTLFGIIDAAIKGNFETIPDIFAANANKIKNTVVDTATTIANDFKEGFQNALNPKEKLKLIDIASEDVVSKAKENSKKLGETIAKTVIEGQRKAIDLLPNPEESAQVVFEKQVTDLLKDEELKRLENTKQANKQKEIDNTNYAVSQRETNEMVLASTANLIGSTINLLARDEEARQKNGRLIKALAIAEIGVNLQKQLSNILTVNGSPTNVANLFSFGAAGAAATAIQSALAVASAGVQIATVSSQKFAKGGILSGPSHASGGIKTPFGELEGGEAVINKKSTKMFSGVLSSINEAGGGKKFARGGILPTPNTISTPNNLNLEVINAIKDIDIKPTVSVVEINDAQARISEIENNSTL